MRQCYCREDDAVFISGTLVEGIGNIYSDIDTYVLTDRLRNVADVDVSAHHRVLTSSREIARRGDFSADVYLIHTVVPGHDIKIDVEFLELASVECMLQEANDIFRYAVNHPILLTKQMTHRQKIFIHRMYIGDILRGSDLLNRLRTVLPAEKYCYILYRWIGSDFSVMLDLMGAWSNGELNRAADLARENLITQMTAYLHLCGVTNPTRKWFWTNMEQHRSSIGSIYSRFSKFFYFSDNNFEEDKKNYVLESLDLIEDLFSLMGKQLETIKDVPSGVQGLALLRDNHAIVGEATDYANLEFDYRAKVFGQAGQRLRNYLGTFGKCRPFLIITE